MEKKRRARINESLQELRTLLADTDVSDERTLLQSSPVPAMWRQNLFLMGLHWFFPQFHSKMENAEVLEMTVKKVEDILKNRAQGIRSSV